MKKYLFIALTVLTSTIFSFVPTFSKEFEDKMIVPISVDEKLLFATYRIETNTGTGSGFAFTYDIEGSESAKKVPVIITNKHVIKGATKGKLFLHLEKENITPQAPSSNSIAIEIEDFENQWICHPKNVDLCALPVANLFKQYPNLYFAFLTENDLPTDEDLKKFQTVEDIIMAGYPIGLWDQVHNLPIIRQGSTASHPAIDYNGDSITVIDAACFPGSSGSPVMYIHKGYRGAKSGQGLELASRKSVLLGILFGGPEMMTTGEIKIQEIPMNSIPISVTRFPINLGYIIKAKEILILKEAVFKKFDIPIN